MPSIVVAKGDKGYKVLVNFIQEGIEYNSQEKAEAEAQKLKDRYNEFYNK